MQMDNRVGAGALFVHRAMQKGFLRRRVPADQLSLPVQLRQPCRVELSQAGIGRSQKPAIIKPRADVAAAACSESAIEQ